MNATKKIGIWMDHSTADLIGLNIEGKQQYIQSKFSFDDKEEALKKGEKHMHNKEKQMHQNYYKEIADEILNYGHVLLFGPTDAKLELHNYLSKDAHFKNVRIDVETTDKLSDKQKEAFVKKHFTE
ncbi:hypothetical protein [Fluviicola sp.]|uniref:hypothetical protein n=1 Tax=Fluviicola sp. TaxID=1917219 RepID=UPI003D288A8D